MFKTVFEQKIPAKSLKIKAATLNNKRVRMIKNDKPRFPGVRLSERVSKRDSQNSQKFPVKSFWYSKSTRATIEFDFLRQLTRLVTRLW